MLQQPKMCTDQEKLHFIFHSFFLEIVIWLIIHKIIILGPPKNIFQNIIPSFLNEIFVPKFMSIVGSIYCVFNYVYEQTIINFMFALALNIK